MTGILIVPAVEGVDRIVRVLNVVRVAAGFRPVFLLLNDYGSLDEVLTYARDAARELGGEAILQSEGAL